MEKIDGITNIRQQNVVVNKKEGVLFYLSLEFLPTQMSWTYSIEKDDFVIKNQRLHLSENLLDRHKNVLQFGLACVSSDGAEPLFLDDFSLGRINLYVLSETEKEEVHDKTFRSYNYE